MTRRLNIQVSDNVAALLDRLAAEQETTVTDMIRRALALLKAADIQRAKGFTHIGFAADPAGLDVEIIGTFD